MRNKLGTSILLSYLFNPEIFHKRTDIQSPTIIKCIYIYIYRIDHCWILVINTFMENFWMDIYIYIYSYIIDHCWILDIYLYTYIYSRLICVIKRTMIVKLFNDSHVSIILNHYYSLFHRINFRISCISVERIRRSKFFSAITRKIRTFECISLEFHETFTILSWRNSTDRREFDGSRNFDKRLRRKKMLAEGKSELCGKI